MQGFYFALSQYSRIQAFTARFAVSMQLYRPRHVRAHTRARTPCTDTSYQTPRRTLYSLAQPPIIIRYIRVQGCAAVMDPCQTVQHIADHDSPAGSASPPVQGQPVGLQSGTGQQSGRTGWHPPPGGAVQRQERGGRRGTIGGYRRSSFRAFAR